jgi:hypothetical protein
LAIGSPSGPYCVDHHLQLVAAVGMNWMAPALSPM